MIGYARGDCKGHHTHTHTYTHTTTLPISIKLIGCYWNYRVPVQYLIEEWDFRHIGLRLKPPVFIPVPETEVR